MLRQPPCIHWARDPEEWLEAERSSGSEVIGVELAEGATPLTQLQPARRRTVVVLGHEHWGLPDEALPHVDRTVEIPMIGHGASLNVAVSGSLVLYRLAGLS